MRPAPVRSNALPCNSAAVSHSTRRPSGDAGETLLTTQASSRSSHASRAIKSIPLSIASTDHCGPMRDGESASQHVNTIDQSFNLGARLAVAPDHN